MFKHTCWAIVAALFFFMTYTPSASAQGSPMTCEVIDDPTGDHFILIDGLPHFYTTVLNSIDIQRRLQLIPLLEEEIGILSTQVDLCKEVIIEKDEIINTLEEEVDNQRQLFDMALEDKPNNNLIPFTVGAVSGVVATFIAVIAYRNLSE